MSEHRDKKEWLVSATEIASYVYCQESWRLTHVLKQPSGNAARMMQGETQHDEWQQVERSTSVGRVVAIVLIVIAVLALMMIINS